MNPATAPTALTELGQQLEAVSTPLLAALDEGDPEKVESLLTQYEELVGKVKAIAQFNRPAVLLCAGIAAAVRREQELLTRAYRRRDELATELALVRQKISVQKAYGKS